MHLSCFHPQLTYMMIYYMQYSGQIHATKEETKMADLRRKMINENKIQSAVMELIYNRSRADIAQVPHNTLMMKIALDRASRRLLELEAIQDRLINSINNAYYQGDARSYRDANESFNRNKAEIAELTEFMEFGSR